MGKFEETSDKLSKMWYERECRWEEGSKTAADAVRDEGGDLWSQTVRDEVDLWVVAERKRIILEAGYTEDEWQRLEDEEIDAWQAQIDKEWNESRGVNGWIRIEVVHMDDDTEPDDVE